MHKSSTSGGIIYAMRMHAWPTKVNIVEWSCFDSWVRDANCIILGTRQSCKLYYSRWDVQFQKDILTMPRFTNIRNSNHSVASQLYSLDFCSSIVKLLILCMCGDRVAYTTNLWRPLFVSTTNLTYIITTTTIYYCSALCLSIRCMS